MQKIADLVEAEIRETPFLESALADGLINQSALARRLKPRIEKILQGRVSTAAITMALRRAMPAVHRKTRSRGRGIERFREITVRSGLVELTYHNSATIGERQRKLWNRLARTRHGFVTYTQGVSEVMLIVGAQTEALARESLAGEHLVAAVADLSALVVRLAPSAVRTPGVYYGILKELAWQSVNVIDVVSTTTEFTIVVQDAQVEVAFATLRRLAAG